MHKLFFREFRMVRTEQTAASEWVTEGEGERKRPVVFDALLASAEKVCQYRNEVASRL